MSDEKKDKQGSKSIPEILIERLESRIEELELDVNCAKEKNSNSYVHHAEALIKKAKDAKEAGRDQSAWAYCHQIKRLLLENATPEERILHAKVLRHEALEKLKNWRREALLEVLDEKNEKDKKDEISTSQIVAAQFLMDQSFDNIYHKLKLFECRIKLFTWILPFVAIAAIVFAGAVSWSTELQQVCFQRIRFVLCDLEQTVMVMLNGVIGAVLSHATKIMKAGGRIPKVLASLQEWSLRIPLGALSALGLVMLLQGPLSSILKIEDPVVLYGYALAAGFSERLLSRAISIAEKSIEK